MAIEIVDFPINSMVILHCYVSSREGNHTSLKNGDDWGMVQMALF